MDLNIKSIYRRCIIEHPKYTIAIVLMLVLGVSIFISKFQYDASAETLLLKNDQNLEYYRAIKARFGSDDYLVITYTPQKEIFNPQTLQELKNLKNDLLQIKNVEYIISILDVPLINSPKITTQELREEIRNIENLNVDLALAKQELLSSSLYQNLLLSEDAKTTALFIGLSINKDFSDLIKQRDQIREKRLSHELSQADLQTIQALTQKIEIDKYALIEQQKQDITAVRQTLEKYSHNAKLFLGGVPMITSDSISYIKYDVMVFGTVVFGLLILILATIFREIRWVLFPLFTCVIVGISATGLFGVIGWPVTVVSSNFLPILLIITLSLTIHLTVHYRETELTHANLSPQDKMMYTVQQKFAPCFYTAATTIVAFGSLLVSRIQPLIDFGWMMALSIFISFIITFTLFPSMLVLKEQGQGYLHRNKITQKINLFLAKTIYAIPKSTLTFYFIVILISLAGMLFLTVENRFIDYYKKSTDIYQGMEMIDTTLGGTTPLDVILDAPQSFFEEQQKKALEQEAYDEEDEFYLDIEDSAGIAFESYWFNSKQFQFINNIHSYLDSLSQTGKVLSLASSMNLLKTLDERLVTDDIILSVMYAAASDDLKQSLFTPYVSQDGNQIRFSIRVFESDYNLRRQELLHKIKTDLVEQFNLKPEQVHLTGMLVLYNNVLQSFFKSQILTLGIVFICIFLMFLLTFRNFMVASIAIVPNLFAGLFVLGLMGWFNIPLDLMTISIAAICVGIAVDDTIHYIHRFKVELDQTQNYWQAVQNAHQSIGLAMFYTTFVITLGFSVLAFSNFVPTIYFGLLTGASMLIALIADLTLLPVLLMLITPYKVTK